MTITEIAIRRPVFLLMVMGLVIVFGLISFSKIGVSLFPKVDIPFVTVVTIYPGAGPEEIETSVSKPIEEAVSTINGIDHVESWSMEGVSTVSLQMKLGINGDNARLDVQKKVDEIRLALPKDIEIPIISKLDVTSMPILNIAIYSPSKPLEELYFIVDKQVKNRLQQIDGVADVAISGENERQINVICDPEKLARYQLSVLDVVDQLKMANLEIPAGLVETNIKEYSVRIAGRFRELDAIRKASIMTPAGAQIYLADIAKVEDSFKKMKSINRFNGMPGLGVSIRQQSGANSVQVIDLVKKELEAIKRELPSDINYGIAFDQSTFTKHSISEVRNNLLEAILLTGIIIFLFLRKIRNTIIVLLAIPTSLIATFSLMYYAGFTFNMLSLMGLATTIGILVDDSIVVLENIDRHFGMGKSAFRASLDGRREISLAAIAVTLTHVAVFIPLAFMGGFVGRFFAEFGLTVTIAVLFSLLVSFTLTPMMTARWLKNSEKAASENSSGKIMKTIGACYGRISSWALSHRALVTGITAIIFIASVALVPLGVVSTEFFTMAERPELMVDIETPSGTSLDKTNAVIRLFEEKIGAIPEVESRFVTLGTSKGAMGRQASGDNIGQMKIMLRKGEGFRSTNEVAQEIRRLSGEIPGITLRVSAPGFSGSSEGVPIQIEVSGSEMNDFAAASSMIIAAIEKIPGIMEIKSTWEEGSPEIKVDVDRDRCSALGLPIAAVGTTLRASIDGDYSNKYKEGDREYDIMVSLPESKKKSSEDIARIPVKTASGNMIELGQVSNIYQDLGPVEIRRKDHNPLFVVNANISNRPLGDVNNDIGKALAGLKLPSTITKVGMGGDVEMMGESFTNLLIALVLSIVFVYMIMASLFESFLYPFIIMFSLPVTLVGAILSLMVTGKTLNLFSMIGVVMLVGLVVMNAILLVDYTNTLRKRGLGRDEALVEAGKTRLRPILMTTLSLLFGMLPLALQLGPGSEMRSGMAVVIMGGMTSSTLLTLVFIPVVYSYMDDAIAWVRKSLHLRSVEIEGSLMAEEKDE